MTAELFGEVDAAIATLHAQIAELATRPGLADDPEALEQLDALTIGLQAREDALALARDAAIHTWHQQRRWRQRQHLRAHWGLSIDSHTSDRTAAHRLRRARFLHEATGIAGAVLDGRLTMDHVDLLIRVATKERWSLFLQHQDLLARHLSRAVTFDEARQIIRYWADRADDELDLPPACSRPSTAGFSRDEVTGEGRLDAHLHPVDAELVQDELERLMRTIRAEDAAQDRRRSPREVRAAALVRMATRSASTEHGDRSRVLLQVAVGADHLRRICELASGTVIRPEDLEGHLGDALVESIIFSGPTTLVATTRQRTLKGAMRRAVMLRDRRCQHHAGCYHRARDCDIGHLQPFGPDVPTGQHTVRAECHGHNRFPQFHSDAPVPPEPLVSEIEIARVRARLEMDMERQRLIDAGIDPDAEPSPFRGVGLLQCFDPGCRICRPSARRPGAA